MEIWGPGAHRAAAMGLLAQDSGWGVGENIYTHLEDACPAPLALAPARPYRMFHPAFNTGRKLMGWQGLLMETPRHQSGSPSPIP